MRPPLRLSRRLSDYGREKKGPAVGPGEALHRKYMVTI
jgi:hypothetical protein